MQILRAIKCRAINLITMMASKKVQVIFLKLYFFCYISIPDIFLLRMLRIYLNVRSLVFILLVSSCHCYVYHGMGCDPRMMQSQSFLWNGNSIRKYPSSLLRKSFFVCLDARPRGGVLENSSSTSVEATPR